MFVKHPIRGGFTLIELILVMVIVTIIVAAVMPNMGNFIQGRKANDATMSILAMANYARTQAATQGYLYRLNVDTQSGRVWLTSDQGGGFTALSGGGDFAQTLILPDGVKVEMLNAAGKPISQLLQPDLLQTQSIEQPAPVNGQQMNVRGTLSVAQRDPGAYIEFDSMGRSDTGDIVVTDQFGVRYALAIDTPADPMRILTDAEVRARR
jgi:prepilin-type N-terminal cleavage/methylation domain-containing protein